MVIATMGKVLVKAKMENLEDLFFAEKGIIAPEAIRSLEVPDALVDTDASTLSLPKRLIAQLGLKPFGTKKALTTAGLTTLPMYGVVRLTIQDRDWKGDVLEVPDECPVIIGQMPLEGLDLVVDTVGQRLIGNPAHGGEAMVELY